MATIKDVAKRAGVSISTVSNVLNSSKYVSDELTQKVQAAIADLHYRVDVTARNMKIRNTKMIGVIVSSFHIIFVPQVMNGIQKYASEHGYQILFYSSDFSFEKEKHCVSLLLDHKVDGIILNSVASYLEKKYFRELASLTASHKKVFVVSLERNLSSYGIFSVHVNNFLGGKIATKYLLEGGCSHIAVISGPKIHDVIYDRLCGYRAALEDAGLVYDTSMIEYGDYTTLSGYLAMKRIIMNGIQFDGVFSCNDQMAIGVLKAMKENRIDCPSRVKVIGFDNTYVSSIAVPSLTTINVPKVRMGTVAAQKLTEMIEGTLPSGEITYEIPIGLVQRTTTDPDKENGIELEDW